MLEVDDQKKIKDQDEDASTKNKMGDGTNLQKSASSAEDINRRNSDSAVVAAPAPASGASVAETDGVQWRRADRKRKSTSSRPQEPNAIVGGPGEIDVHAFIASTEQPPVVSEGTLKGNGNGGKEKNAHLPLSTRQEISSRTVSD